MMYLNQDVQAVILLLCEKHAPQLKEKVPHFSEGNWYVLPDAAACQMGYRPYVSTPHSGAGCAVLGFAENVALERAMEELSCLNENGSVCPDCVAYEWSIRPRSLQTTARDPICGKTVNCESAFPLHHDDGLFYFCSIGCRDKFQSTLKSSQSQSTTSAQHR